MSKRLAITSAGAAALRRRLAPCMAQPASRGPCPRCSWSRSRSHRRQRSAGPPLSCWRGGRSTRCGRPVRRSLRAWPSRSRSRRYPPGTRGSAPLVAWSRRLFHGTDLPAPRGVLQGRWWSRPCCRLPGRCRYPGRFGTRFALHASWHWPRTSFASRLSRVTNAGGSGGEPFSFVPSGCSFASLPW